MCISSRLCYGMVWVEPLLLYESKIHFKHQMKLYSNPHRPKKNEPLCFFICSRCQSPLLEFNECVRLNVCTFVSFWLILFVSFNWSIFRAEIDISMSSNEEAVDCPTVQTSIGWQSRKRTAARFHETLFTRADSCFKAAACSCCLLPVCTSSFWI